MVAVNKEAQKKEKRTRGSLCITVRKQAEKEKMSNEKKKRTEFVGGVWMDAGDEERRREEERSETAGIKRGEV